MNQIVESQGSYMKVIPTETNPRVEPTPNQVIEGFLEKWTPISIQTSFWEIFRLAVLGGLEKEVDSLSPEIVAELFDGLVEFVAAVQALHPVVESSDLPDHLLEGQEGTTYE